MNDRNESRRQLVTLAITVFSIIVVLAAIIVLLWVGGWWPDKLIPWLPFERV